MKTISDSKTRSKTLALTSEQRCEINKSGKTIEQGLFIDQVILDEEYNKWLSAR